MRTILVNTDTLRDRQLAVMPNVMAIGCFDGLHLGHRQVIRIARQIAKRRRIGLSVMSFSPHPRTVLSDGKVKVPRLMPLEEKEDELRKLGVDFFYLVEFTKEFAALAPEQFAVDYVAGLGAVHAVAGFDFKYGSRGAGHMDRLASDSNGLLEATKVAEVDYRGEKISSTAIRTRLLGGEVEQLPPFLGRNYEIRGRFEGRSFLPEPGYTVPAAGCYEVRLKNAWQAVNSEIRVTETREGQSVSCKVDRGPVPLGKAAVEWLRRIEEPENELDGEFAGSGSYRLNYLFA
ncbi:FAD synthetase family protein [Cohnella sp. AR92]|uniref:FAD synthetase family protein n=1 Tax=Cohnella sp. AR92 TaxID=648716 RepID=UPI000F8C7672|nr:FAD synthetase family protein [Cohnella sp. AR92]RUS43912.1 FAD synthetase family protein [Cohnella sp. AR92]